MPSLAPMSTPRVGWSSKMMSEPPLRHLAITTFCWLPPESLPALACTDGALIARRAIHCAAVVFSAAMRSTPARL